MMSEYKERGGRQSRGETKESLLLTFLWHHYDYLVLHLHVRYLISIQYSTINIIKVMRYNLIFFFFLFSSLPLGRDGEEEGEVNTMI